MAFLPTEDVADADQCCICFESLGTDGVGGQRLPCGHVMHEVCVTELRLRRDCGRCPLCRQSHTALASVRVLMARAAVHRSRNEFRAAANIYAEVLDVEPTNATALLELGLCYYHGDGVPQDINRGSELVEEAYHRGRKADAAFSLGYICKDKGDIQRAMALYEEARRGGVVSATFNLGHCYKKEGDIPQAILLYEEARRDGHAKAAFNLGVCYKDMG